MLGAIAGDIIGSSYEYSRQKNYDFELFTKDSVTLRSKIFGTYGRT